MCMPDGEEGVWRIAAESRSLGSQPRFSAWDGVGRALQIDPIFFEDQCIPDGTVEGVRRRMVVSVRVPAATGGLFVVAEDETGAALPAMLGFDKAAFFGELHRALRRVRNAADEDDYRAWRESRKMGGLSGSRLDPEVSLSPLVSIVVPCYRVNERYFEEMLESVLAQSYVRWELVLVDSECESSKVPGIVERIADDRITVVPLRDNLGIVGNTNAGIQHARASTWRSSSTTTCWSRTRWRRTSRPSSSIPTRACCTATRTRSRSGERSGTLCSRLISTEICCTHTIASRIGSWCARMFWPRRACPTTR